MRPPEVLLQRALHSPTICVDEFNVDMIKSQWNKVPIASVAACRRKAIGRGAGDPRTLRRSSLSRGAGFLALVRTAAQRHRLPRKAKTVLHVFLNEVQGLAVLAAATLPIAWRKFALPAGREGPEIFSVQRTLQALEKHYGVEAPLDAVVIYGRGDLHAELEEEAAAEASGSPVRCYKGPAMDGRRDRLRIGLGVPESKPAGLRPVASAEAQGVDPGDFPLGELALEVAMVICLGLLLAGRNSVLAGSYQAVLAEKARHACLASTPRRRSWRRKEANCRKRLTPCGVFSPAASFGRPTRTICRRACRTMRSSSRCKGFANWRCPEREGARQSRRNRSTCT